MATADLEQPETAQNARTHLISQEVVDTAYDAITMKTVLKAISVAIAVFIGLSDPPLFLVGFCTGLLLSPHLFESMRKRTRRSMETMEIEAKLIVGLVFVAAVLSVTRFFPAFAGAYACYQFRPCLRRAAYER